MWGNWTGLSRHSLRDHPNFPREGLARSADDPNPNLHRGAAADPRLPLETLLGLLDDEKPAEPAASNPALPVETMQAFSTVPESPDPAGHAPVPRPHPVQA